MGVTKKIQLAGLLGETASVRVASPALKANREGVRVKGPDSAEHFMVLVARTWCSLFIFHKTTPSVLLLGGAGKEKYSQPLHSFLDLAAASL